jgi:hypothetical protein
MGPYETLKKGIKKQKKECLLGSTSHEGISQVEGYRELPLRLPVNSPLENIYLSGLWT